MGNSTTSYSTTHTPNCVGRNRTPYSRLPEGSYPVRSHRPRTLEPAEAVSESNPVPSTPEGNYSALSNRPRTLEPAWAITQRTTPTRTRFIAEVGIEPRTPRLPEGNYPILSNRPRTIEPTGAMGSHAASRSKRTCLTSEVRREPRAPTPRRELPRALESTRAIEPAWAITQRTAATRTCLTSEVGIEPRTPDSPKGTTSHSRIDSRALEPAGAIIERNTEQRTRLTSEVGIEPCTLDSPTGTAPYSQISE